MTIRTEQDALLDSVKRNTGSAIQPSEVVLIPAVGALHAGPFFAITALIDSTIDVSECVTNITNAADFILPKGVTMYGNFTSIYLITAGKVLAYKL
tara:strand:+ start:136 stop:423 length:288 start_codon:yes stop_codon:yes gene_type:complete